MPGPKISMPLPVIPLSFIIDLRARRSQIFKETILEEICGYYNKKQKLEVDGLCSLLYIFGL